jgi:hypothetical protein
LTPVELEAPSALTTKVLGISASGLVVVGGGGNANVSVGMYWNANLSEPYSTVSNPLNGVSANGLTALSDEDPDVLIDLLSAETETVGAPGDSINRRLDALSADGTIVVGSYSDGVRQRGFIWDSINGARALDPSLGSEDEGPTDVSGDAKFVVGWYGTDQQNGMATIWDSLWGLRLLASELTQRGLELSPDRVFESAQAISLDGSSVASGRVLVRLSP